MKPMPQIAALALFASLPAAAAEPCPMTYPKFEFAVPHIDLDTCPAPMAGEGRFCRAAAGSDMLHVYAFAEDGDQCLIAMDSFEEDAFSLTLK